MVVFGLWLTSSQSHARGGFLPGGMRRWVHCGPALALFVHDEQPVLVCGCVGLFVPHLTSAHLRHRPASIVGAYNYCPSSVHLSLHAPTSPSTALKTAHIVPHLFTPEPIILPNRTFHALNLSFLLFTTLVAYKRRFPHSSMPSPLPYIRILYSVSLLSCAHPSLPCAHPFQNLSLISYQSQFTQLMA